MADHFHDIIQLGAHGVPGAWAHLLPEDAQWLRLPNERFAACTTCPPVKLGDYVSECRCCGYLPQMTNFAVGFALQGPSASVMRSVIADGHALPFGLSPSPRLFAEAIATNAQGRFGQEPSLACPFKHPETHHCGVYAYRNSVCSTFFCHHDQGDQGEEFWSLLQAVAGSAETAVAQWAMGQAGLPSTDVFATMDHLAEHVSEWVHGDRSWSERALDAIWGIHRGHEEAFFTACADQVRSHRDELLTIASQWTLQEPAGYQQALKAALPEPSQEIFPQIDDGSVERIPLDELWYRLQLAERELWLVPFGETVQLVPGAELETVVSQDRLPILIGGARRGLRIPRANEGPLSLYPSKLEARALRLFEEPQVLNEALMDRPELTAIDDARSFLAEYLRLGALVRVS